MQRTLAPPDLNPPPLPRQELTASLRTRQELGERMEDEVVDSFLSRIERGIDARVEGRLRGRRPVPAAGTTDVGGVWLALGSFSLGIPLTAIAAGIVGLPGLLAVWGGIAVVNIAYHQRRKD
jgi:hypothetical protein